jgi:glyoxylase-like metal-dependent hydrolase (beta-lactamase superfamily II)
VHEHDPDTFVLRQSLCTSFEAPFLVLFFGEERALLEDTGAGGIDVVGAVDDVIAAWLAARGRASIDLVVVNSHGHGDHTAGNAAFAARPGTTVIGTGISAVVEYFGLRGWPDDAAVVDLGERSLDVLPIPGHQGVDLALFDRRTRLLFTGDTLYPGRLYIRDFAAYRASLHRLVGFAEASPPCQVLGTHVEMTDRPGEDFAFGADVHAGERALALDPAHISELVAGLDAMAAAPAIEVHDDFIIYPLD